MTPSDFHKLTGGDVWFLIGVLIGLAVAGCAVLAFMLVGGVAFMVTR